MPEQQIPAALLQLRQDINKTDLSLLRILGRRIRNRREDPGKNKQTIGATRGRFRRLVAHRDELVDDVGIVKQINDIPVVAPDRRNTHLDELITTGARLGIPNAVVRYGYDYLHRRAVEIQQKHHAA